MDLDRRAIALYGRFTSGTHERFQRRIVAAGGRVARDLTQRSDILVIGALATALIDSGRLGERLKSAKARRVPVMGERAFAAALAGETGDEAAALPLTTALAPTSLTPDDAEILAAFDLVLLKGDRCRFADAGIIRTAADLVAQRRSRAEVVRILTRARDLAPLGRHKIVLTPSGDAALEWESGLTTLEGQGYLPLEPEAASVDDLFEQAELYEVSGDREQAARLYELCARTDRSDAIALFNLGNIRLAQGRHGEAERAYRRALVRDADFCEALYNLALTLEASGKFAAASDELGRLLALDPGHGDALFNRAQLLMKAGMMAEAKTHYERYLSLDPPSEWAAMARKAITYCAARLQG